MSALDVSLLTIPDTIAFALLIGVSPTVGLVTTVVMMLVGAMGGQPGIISGSTAAVAVTVGAAVSSMGMRVLLPLVVMSGVIQVLAGLVGVHKLVAYIPRPVVSGFLIGLGVLMALAQLAHFKEMKAKHDGGSEETEEHFGGGEGDVEWLSAKTIGMGLTLIDATTIFLQVRTGWKVVPPSIMATIIITAIVYLLVPKSVRENRIRTVGNFGTVSLSPDKVVNVVKQAYSGLKTVSKEDLLKLLPYALSIAAAGLIESLLTVREIDEKLHLKGSNVGSLKRETFVQGLANISVGLLGGQGGCALVGQTMVNIDNGGSNRRVVVICGLLIAAIMLLGGPLISMVPAPALIASIGFIVYKTIDWKALGEFNPSKKETWVVMSTAIVSILTHNLAAGTGAGVVINAVFQAVGGGEAKVNS
eukprot:gene10926-17040_t